MVLKMWQKLNTPGTEYFLCSNNQFEIYITDFVKIWFEKFSEESFLGCLKQSNPNLILDNNDFLKKGLMMVTNPEMLKSLEINEEGSGLDVSFYRSFNYLVCLKMRLSEGSQALFFQKITSKLLNVIQDLHESENTLQNLLRKKNREIKEYKDEGGQLSLKHYKTDPFDEAVHASKHTAYLDNFGSSELPESLLKKQILVPESQIVEIKEEPINEINGPPCPVIQEPEQIKVEDIKSEPETIKSESETIKNEPETIKNESESLKSEPINKSQLIRPGVSSSKGTA